MDAPPAHASPLPADVARRARLGRARAQEGTITLEIFSSEAELRDAQHERGERLRLRSRREGVAQGGAAASSVPLQLDWDLLGLSVTVLSSAPRELLHLAARQLRGTTRALGDYQLLKLSLGHLQVCAAASTAAHIAPAGLRCCLDGTRWAGRRGGARSPAGALRSLRPTHQPSTRSDAPTTRPQRWRPPPYCPSTAIATSLSAGGQHDVADCRAAAQVTRGLGRGRERGVRGRRDVQHPRRPARRAARRQEGARRWRRHIARARLGGGCGGACGWPSFPRADCAQGGAAGRHLPCGAASLLPCARARAYATLDSVSSCGGLFRAPAVAISGGRHAPPRSPALWRSDLLPLPVAASPRARRLRVRAHGVDVRRDRRAVRAHPRLGLRLARDRLDARQADRGR